MTCQCDDVKVFQVRVPGIQGPQGKPGEPGKDGEDGEDGKTPVIEVKAETLPEGSEATVMKEGTDENPSFTFGIPKGDKGDRGEAGTTETIDNSFINNLFGAI